MQPTNPNQSVVTKRKRNDRVKLDLLKKYFGDDPDFKDAIECEELRLKLQEPRKGNK